MHTDQEQAAVHVLTFASCLHADGIPRRILESFVGRLVQGHDRETAELMKYFREVLRILLNRHLVQSDMCDDFRITIHRFVQAAANQHLKGEDSKEALQLVFKHGMETFMDLVPLARYAAKEKRLLALDSLVHAASFAANFASMGFGDHPDIIKLQIELADYYVRLVGAPREAMTIIDCAE